MSLVPGQGQCAAALKPNTNPLLAPAHALTACSARSRSFGPDAIPGDARWRRGESVSLKAARDSMVSLELAQHAQMVYSKRS
jgi:hypothetical protein